MYESVGAIPTTRCIQVAPRRASPKKAWNIMKNECNDSPTGEVDEQKNVMQPRNKEWIEGYGIKNDKCSSKTND